MKRYLITSALPYINGIKHLGNLAGSMLPADVHARFRRMRDDEVLFLCATDEHGTPAELAAAGTGQDIRTYCDVQHHIQKSIYEQFRISFDWFGRSSSAKNAHLTQHFCDLLEDNGFIEERLSKQLYSLDDGRFLPDRYVEGVCPLCGHDPARGDQCDNCGNLLTPTELLSPRSKISGSTKLEVRETVHLYLLQSKMQREIGEWVHNSHSWGHLAKSIAVKWLTEGLHDRSITRDLSWGVPVTRHGKPRPGFESKVFYVWFDAPIEYIACAQEWAEACERDWARWWRTDQGAGDVTYLQFMGKDNVAFHAINFPATLIGSREPWKMVDTIKAFNWVTWYSSKFSTSEKRGVFTDQALDILPSDLWRWKLMANAPESADSSFSLEDLRNTVNSDLGNVFGNFINRVVKFTESRFDSKVPLVDGWSEAEERLAEELGTRLSDLAQHHDALDFRRAAAETRGIWVLANEYLSLAAPWKVIKTDVRAAAQSVRAGLNLCVICALIAFPFIPDAAETILEAFQITEPKWPKGNGTDILSQLEGGHAMRSLPVLFERIEGIQVQHWEKLFNAPGLSTT